MTQPTFENDIKMLMTQNERSHGDLRYTVPSPELYPFQWLWDSCFHAIILSHFDLERAKDEIRSVVAKPLENGLLPHIIFWDKNYKDTNWGRENRGDILNSSWGVNDTSSLTQPPILAVAILEIMKKDADLDFLAEVYDVVSNYYTNLLSLRTRADSDLLGIVNPDESGEDNSPRFDSSISLASRHTIDMHLTKRIGLIKRYAMCEFNHDCMDHFFWVEDVPFNSIAIAGLDALSELALLLGKTNDAVNFKRTAEKIRVAMRDHLLSKNLFHSRNFIDETYQRSSIKTWALFAPLFGGVMQKAEADFVIEHYLLNEAEFLTPYLIPSVSQSEPSFDRDGFWRGPTWMAVNWLVYKGLKRSGYIEAANLIRKKSHALIEKSGFREQYDPLSGVGLGARDFTWGGLVLDMD